MASPLLQRASTATDRAGAFRVSHPGNTPSAAVSRPGGTLPTAPGDSPFKVRGFVYQRCVEHANLVDGGLERVVASLEDPRVADFVKQPFRWMGWYDALPMVPLETAIAELRGRDLGELLRERGALGIEKAMPSMFRFILSMGSPSAAVQHAPRLMQTYWSFVDLTIERMGPNEGAGRLHRMPRILAPVTLDMILGVLSGSLRMLGQDPTGAHYDLAPDTPRDGYETVSVHARITWR